MFLESAGALAGLSVFVSQAVGYLGYENFVRDIYLTFLARNDANNAATLMSEAAHFYENKHVIFWHNWSVKIS